MRHKAQRREVVTSGHSENYIHCQPPSHQPSSAPGTLVLSLVHLVPSTFSEAASPTSPPGGERGVPAALQGPVCGRDPPRALLSCAPGAKGRLCTPFMAGPPPRTVNRGAGSWHWSPPGSRLLVTSERKLRTAAFLRSLKNYTLRSYSSASLSFLPSWPDSTH